MGKEAGLGLVLGDAPGNDNGDAAFAHTPRSLSLLRKLIRQRRREVAEMEAEARVAEAMLLAGRN